MSLDITSVVSFLTARTLRGTRNHSDEGKRFSKIVLFRYEISISSFILEVNFCHDFLKVAYSCLQLLTVAYSCLLLLTDAYSCLQLLTAQ